MKTRSADPRRPARHPRPGAPGAPAAHERSLLQAMHLENRRFF